MGDSMSLIKSNNITNVAGGVPTVKGQQLIPTAWVNFGGVSTVAIRDSEGVSSITDVATGKYNINFATAMANTHYSAAFDVHPASHTRFEFAHAFAPLETARIQIVTGISVYGVDNHLIDQETVTGVFMGGQS